MSQASSAHAREVSNEIADAVLAKYLAGQREHGGYLPKKAGLLEHAINEALDQTVYLFTLRAQLHDTLELLNEVTARLNKIMAPPEE